MTIVLAKLPWHEVSGVWLLGNQISGHSNSSSVDSGGTAWLPFRGLPGLATNGRIQFLGNEQGACVPGLAFNMESNWDVDPD